MGKISEIFNFENIGGKIKGFAKWSCWITILLIWIAAAFSFVFIVTDEWKASFWWIPIIGAIAGPISVWLGCWALYAFGQLVEDVHALRSNKSLESIERNISILAEPQKKQAEENRKKAAAEQSRKDGDTPKHTSWTCNKCKIKNLDTRTTCWNCGEPKGLTVKAIVDGDKLICPNCKKEQLSNRKICWHCGAEFSDQ